MDVANILLRATGENAEAKRSLEEIALEMRKIASEEFTAELKVKSSDAIGEVVRLEAALDLISKRDYTAHVKVKVDDAKAKFDTLKSELEHALAGGAGARPLENIFGDIQGLAGNLEQLSTETGKVGGTFADLSLKTVGLGAAAAGAGILILGLVGVLGALAASLAAAVAGAALLAVTFAITLLPVLLLAVAAVFEFKKATDASKKAQQEEAEASQRVKSARQELASATDRVKTATQSVTDAQSSVAEQADAAWKDWRSTIQGVHDDMLNVQYAQLGITQANLNVRKAAQELKDALSTNVKGNANVDDLFGRFKDVNFDPGDTSKLLQGAGAGVKPKDQLDIQQKALDYKRALLDQKRANDDLGKSTQKLGEDQAKVAAYNQQGIAAYKPYTDAVKQLQRQEEELHSAERVRAADQTKLTAALQKQSDVQGKFTKQQREFGSELKQLGKDFTAAIEPLAKPILKGALDLIKDIMEVFKDTKVRLALLILAASMKDFLENVGKFVKSDEFKAQFTRFTLAAAALVHQLGSRAFIDFLKIMLRLADAALPEVLRFAGKIADQFDKWERGTRNANGVRRVIGQLISSFNIWMGVAKSLAKVILSFFIDGKSSGDDLGRSIKRVLDRWNAFLNSDEGRKKVKQFLSDAIELATQFFGVLGIIIGAAISLLHYFEKIVNEIKKIVGFGKDLKNTVEDAADVVPGGKGAVKKALGFGKKVLGASGPGVGTGLKELGKIFGGNAGGGMVPGAGGFGDDQIRALEGGEYVIKRSVVNSLGAPFFDALNYGVSAGSISAAPGGKRGGGVHIDKIILPPAPAAAVPDGKFQAAQLRAELSRRGG